MLNKKELKDTLSSIITKNSVFVCVGTTRALFDAFAPWHGDYLKAKGIPVYGTSDANVNALTMYSSLNKIYNKDRVLMENIIAIDSAITYDIDKKNKIEVRIDKPIYPGAGVGKALPTIGKHSLVMYTLTKDEVDDVMNGYRDGLGAITDIADVEKIMDNAKMLADIIEEIYLEKGGKLVHE